MVLTMPFFPLSVVVFPKEEMNLHIFETRYVQLINDCMASDKRFGMPFFVEDELKPLGALLEIKAIAKRYEEGPMDIRVEGLTTFEWLNFDNPWRDRLYAGGKARVHPEPQDDSTILERRLLVARCYDLFALLDFSLPLDAETSFLVAKVAHKVGLTLAQEYHLVGLQTERQKINYLIAHLNKFIPLVKAMERTKARVQLNGHFQRFDPLQF